MKTQKFTYLIIFCLATFFCQAQIQDIIRINEYDIKTSKTEVYDRITWNSDYKAAEEGKPELPAYRVSYVLPIDAKLTGVTFQLQEKRLFKQDVYIYPAQAPIPVGYSEDITFTQPDKKVYDSNAPYPGKLYDIESDVIMHGYHVVTLCIYPFEYLPKSRVLNYYPNLEYTVEYESGGNPDVIRPKTQSVLRADLSKIFIKHFVQNASDVEKFGSTARSISNGRTIIQQNFSGLRSQGIAVLDENVPDYIIITCDSLKQAFQPLIEWKTKKGIFTIVMSVEEINVNYTGNDLPEKIRKYLLDVHIKWGDNLFILLGGDINIIPSRMVKGVEDALVYPTDKYYSTTDSWTWDNSNHVFKGNDNQSYINFLGRIPVSNTQEISTIISKTIAYEKADGLGNLNYLKNNLYADAYISDRSGYLSDFAMDSIKNYVNSYASSFNNKFICDDAYCSGNSKYGSSGSDCNNGHKNGDIELCRDSFLLCLNTGASHLGIGKFHFIYHMDHSGPPSLGASNKDKGQTVHKTDIDNLTNGPSWQILMSGGCKPANFYYDCIGKHYLINPNGGGVAFIGNTDNGWSSEYRQLQKKLQSLYTMGRYDIGSAFQKAAEYDNGYHQRWRLHLLGDPEMQVWTNTPNSFSVTVNTPSVYCQESTVSVTVSGLQNVNEKIRICLYKEDEVFEVFEAYGNNTYTYTGIYPITTGDLHVTVTAHDYIPVEKTISVAANSTPHIYISNVTIDDTTGGNGDGQADAGETIELEIGLTNNGSTPASGVTAQLSCSSPYINITTTQVSFGNISAGQTQASPVKYVFEIDKDAPEILQYDSNIPVFTLYISDGSGNSFTRTFNMEIFCPDLQFAGMTITGGALSAGQTVSFNAGLLNTGRTEATGLTAVLKDNGSNVICTRSYPDIGQNKTAENTAPFQFQIPPSYTPGSELELLLGVENASFRKWYWIFDLAEPEIPAPTDIGFSADTTSINLYWTPQIDTGYNVYRSSVDENDAPVGDYVKLNRLPMEFAYFTDTGLEKLIKYYYKIVPVSRSGKAGTPGEKLAWTSLSTINLFPVQMSFDSMLGGIQAVDVNGDGYQEIFANAMYGYIAGLDHYGNELFDIDNNVTTNSGFAKVNAEIYGTLAIGHLLGNNEIQLAGATHQPGKDGLYRVFCFFTKDKDEYGNKLNQPDSVWITTTSKGCHSGVVAANIDNSPDGSMEIIVPNNNGTIDIYNSADGTIKTTINNGIGSAYNSVAVSDLDGDGQVEIIRASNSGIYVWRYNSISSTCNMQTLYSMPAGNGWNFKNSAVVCDIDNCGEKEVLAVALNSAGQCKVYAVKLDGTLVDGWQLPEFNNAGTVLVPGLSIGDLDRDGNLEIVAAGKDKIHVWDNLGNVIPGSPISVPISSDEYAIPILADIDSNPDDIEIILGSNAAPNVYAFKMNGSEVLGFPMSIRTRTRTAVCVSDIDMDGKNELIAGVEDLINVWATEGKPENIEWGRQRYDQYNTGEYSKCLKPIIRKNTTWDSKRVVCDDIIVESGTLTLSSTCMLTMKESSTIIVSPGAGLVIDGASILNANLKALPQSSVTLKNNAYVKLRKNGEFNIFAGATFDYQYGSIAITPQ